MTKTYGPYEPTRQAGNLIFVSGQVGIDPSSGKAEASVKAQTAQALTNLQNLLNGELSHVVKTTVYLRDMSDFTAFNDVYVQFFDTTPRPARACVGVSDLPHLADVPLLVEIEAVAEVRE